MESHGAGGDAPPVIFAPGLLECKLAVLREKVASLTRVAAVAMRMTDADVPLLFDILNHSECDVTELDLSFNRLTDEGLRTLCEVLAREGLMATRGMPNGTECP